MCRWMLGGNAPCSSGLGMREQKSSTAPLRIGLFSTLHFVPLEVHPPMSQRVCALTFLRSTCPRCGDRLRLQDVSVPLRLRHSVLCASMVFPANESAFVGIAGLLYCRFG